MTQSGLSKHNVQSSDIKCNLCSLWPLINISIGNIMMLLRYYIRLWGLYTNSAPYTFRREGTVFCYTSFAYIFRMQYRHCCHCQPTAEPHLPDDLVWVLLIYKILHKGLDMVTPISCYWFISIKVKIQVIYIEYDPPCNVTSKAKSALLVALQDGSYSIISFEYSIW